MNKYTKQNIFVTVSQPLNALVAFKGHFTDQTDRFSYPLFTSSREFPTLSYTEVWKRWVEPPCVGHYRECPPPASPQTNNGVMKFHIKDNILINVVSYNSIQALSSELVILASPWLERQKHDWALLLGSKLILLFFFSLWQVKNDLVTWHG